MNDTIMKKEDNYSERSLESLAAEVREKIHSLVKKGYSPSLIEGWIKEAVSPGGLTITTDYRILLTESGKEIVMRPLEKALYLFFLQHEPGCRFKELPQHNDELLRIYNRITVFDDIQENQRRISRLVDPLSKSFLEKCSVIRRSFLSVMTSIEAESYCITGSRGELRRILLDRSLVKWETKPLQ